MIWQDIVAMIGCYIFAFALVPTVLNKHKPEPLTSGACIGACLALLVVFVSLNLWLSAIAEFVCALFWFTLLVQVLLIKRRKK